MLRLGIEVNFRNRKMPLSYVLLTLLWQILACILGVLMSRGINDSRIIFIIGTYIGHAISVGCIHSYLTTFWYILENLTHRFGVINKCLE